MMKWIRVVAKLQVQLHNDATDKYACFFLMKGLQEEAMGCIEPVVNDQQVGNEGKWGDRSHWVSSNLGPHPSTNPPHFPYDPAPVCRGTRLSGSCLSLTRLRLGIKRAGCSDLTQCSTRDSSPSSPLGSATFWSRSARCPRRSFRSMHPSWKGGRWRTAIGLRPYRLSPVSTNTSPQKGSQRSNCQIKCTGPTEVSSTSTKPSC